LQACAAEVPTTPASLFGRSNAQQRVSRTALTQRTGEAAYRAPQRERDEVLNKSSGVDDSGQVELTFVLVRAVSSM
jgi:hypothetical protein